MTAPTLMIVEDEIILAMELEEKLADMGYRVVGRVASGEEALKKAGELLPDLVVMDIRLDGGLDGIETAKLLRKKYFVPVVYLTAYTDEKTLQRAKLTEPFGYLVKPYSERELRTTVEMSLHKASMERRLRESEERFRTVIETAEDLIFIKDSALRYTHVNPAMLRMIGRDGSKVIGKTDGELFGGEEAKHSSEVEFRVLEGQTVNLEHSTTFNNQRVTCSFIRVPLRDARGKVSGLCGIGRDITELKRREMMQEPEMQDSAQEIHFSEAMKNTLNQVRLAAGTDSICLLLGESGCGKDYLAKYLHDHSPRASGPFFSINCAALAPELAESELFGHERGAFTGAAGRKRGLLELAEGGTLLLNEIGELSLKLQAKLLAFLDTKSFNRVGGEKSISVNARLVAATNRDLEKDVETGKFRKDLFYRLNVITIRVPPLRERKGDLKLLVRDLIESLVKALGFRGTPSVDREAMELLECYDWPGNVRELRNVLERALIHSDKKHITPEQISLASKAPSDETRSAITFTVTVSEGSPMPDALQEAKRHIAKEGLRRSGGSVKEAAQLLGISRDALNYLLKSLSLRKS
jgi:two-component system, NtrC family, response regulator AtoC